MLNLRRGLTEQRAVRRSGTHRLIAAARLPPKGRDYRLDLLRGFAIWAIFLDHIPNNAVNWITLRSYGFNDAADL